MRSYARVIAVVMIVGAFVFSSFVMFIPVNVSAAPDEHVWDGGGGDVYAGTHQNWVSNIAPTAGDAILFDAGALPCVWNLSLAFDSFTINGYTGTIVQGVGVAFSVTSFTIASGTFTGPAGVYELSDSGNFTQSGGTITSDTLKLRMVGNNKTITTTGVNTFWSLRISGNCTIAGGSSTTTRILTVDMGKTLTIDGISLKSTWHYGWVYANSGTIAAVNGGDLYFWGKNGVNPSITLAVVTCPVSFVLMSDATSGDTVTFSATTQLPETLTITSLSATHWLYVDASGYNLTVEKGIINGTRSILYYSDLWLPITQYTIINSAGLYGAMNMDTLVIEYSESSVTGYADNVTQYAIDQCVIDDVINFATGDYQFFSGKTISAPYGSASARYAVAVDGANHLTISGSAGATLRFRDDMNLTTNDVVSIFRVSNSTYVTFTDLNFTWSHGLVDEGLPWWLSMTYTSAIYTWDAQNVMTHIVIEGCTFSGLNWSIYGDGGHYIGEGCEIINNHFIGGEGDVGSFGMSLHNQPSYCNVSGNTFDGFNLALQIDSVTDVLVSDNEFLNCRWNYSAISIYDNVRNVTITNNTFESIILSPLLNSSAVWLQHEAGKPDSRNVSIQNNTFTGFHYGILVGAANDTHIQDNSFLSVTVPVHDEAQNTTVVSNLNHSLTFEGEMSIGRNYIEDNVRVYMTLSTTQPLTNITWASIWAFLVGPETVGSLSLTFTGLDASMGYKVYQDGVVIYQQLEGFTTLTFEATGGGEFEVIAWSVEPSSGPMAYFSYTIDGAVLTCVDHSYNGAVSWVWNFGDGYGSTDQNPTHKYLKSGKYILSLTVYDSEGRSSLATTQIDVVFGEDMPVERDDGGWNIWVSDDLTIGVSAAGLIIGGGLMFVSAMYFNVPIITSKGRKVIGILMIIAGAYFFIFVDNNWLG